VQQNGRASTLSLLIALLATFTGPVGPFQVLRSANAFVYLSYSWHRKMQALEAAKVGVKKLEKEGKKWQRPIDYYAEMVKSDEQMARVKSQLMHEQTQISEAQERWATLQNVTLKHIT